MSSKGRSTFFHHQNLSADAIKSYSISLGWFNLTKSDTKPYINLSENEQDLVTDLLTPALKWAQANPDGDVYLWYDSVHTTPTAIANTQAVLSRLLTDGKIHNLACRDVREIPIVAKNPDAFSDQIALYCRIDLLKCIIIVDSIERNSHDAAIFSDLQVGDCRPQQDRMNKKALFSSDIMQHLIEWGLLLNTATDPLFEGDVENQFLQLVNNRAMINALKHCVINTTLMRLFTALNNTHQLEIPRNERVARLGESVYYSLSRHLYPYYLATIEKKKIFLSDPNSPKHEPTEVEYDIEKHGYEPMRLIGTRGGDDLLLIKQYFACLSSNK